MFSRNFVCICCSFFFFSLVTKNLINGFLFVKNTTDGQKNAWVNMFDISAVVSCIILNEKRKNNPGDRQLKRGRKGQPMRTKEKRRQLKEQGRSIFQIQEYHGGKVIRKEDKKKHNCKELERSSSFFWYYFGARFCNNPILPYRKRESKIKCLFFSNLSEKTHLHNV